MLPKWFSKYRPHISWLEFNQNVEIDLPNGSQGSGILRHDFAQTEACPLRRYTNGIIAKTRMAAKKKGAPGIYMPFASTEV